MTFAPVSVIIPVLNRQTSVCQAIESVLQQTLPAAEIIVVDDGSTDNTVEVLRQQFPTVKVLSQKNQGVSIARNNGIHASSQPWIALLDSDDRWFKNKLEIQFNAIASDDACILCHCDEIWIRNGKRVNPMHKHRKRGGEIFEHCLPLCAISPSAVVLRTDVLNDIGLFDEQLPVCEDYDLWLRLCAKFPVLYIDEPLLEKTGGHNDQLSRKYWGMDRFRLRALAKLLRSNQLDHAQQKLAMAMFEFKFNIVSTGAKKRDNHELLTELNTHYADLLNPDHPNAG